MYTLSLDEVGKFESAENNPKFIGGLIYDDADDIYELSLEKKRIRSFYQTVLRKLSNKLGEEYPYPKSIHWDNNKSEEQNKKTSKIVKGEIDKYLPEFLKYGTLNGKNLKDQNGNEYRERKGKYYIYCILKSDAGKSNCLGETEKNLLKSDDVAANLYFHMADEMLGRMVFNNPVVKSNENFKLEIATRITQTFKKGEEKTKEFANFNPVRERDNGKPVLTKQKEKGEYYEIGNIDIYRTIISKYIVENNNKNINIVDLLVESIDYNNKPKICKYEMLYMADSICSYLSYNLEKLNNSVEWLNEIQKRCEKIFDTNHIFVFGYDDIDVEYSKANNMLIANDYYGALSVCFDSEKNISDFSKFYLKRWFPFIENRIKSSKNIIALEK